MALTQVVAHNDGGFLVICSCGDEQREMVRSEAYRAKARHQREIHPEPDRSQIGSAQPLDTTG